MSAQPQPPDRNLAMELVRVTEAAALASARWMGRGDKEGADAAATEAMRVILSTVQMDGIIVIGEGEKDDAPMLYNGENVGDGSEPQTDIAVDPLEGTTLTAMGRSNALCVIAVSGRGTMFNPGPAFYMDKLAVGAEAAGSIDITQSPTDNLKSAASALKKSVRDMTAVVLDRPRHNDLIEEIRAAGARIRLIQDGDVAGAISTGWPESGAGGADLLDQVVVAGPVEHQVVGVDDLVSGDNCFFAATGVTDGELLRGVHYDSRGATTQSLVMRSKSGTVRSISARHPLHKIAQFSAVAFD